MAHSRKLILKKKNEIRLLYFQWHKVLKPTEKKNAIYEIRETMYLVSYQDDCFAVTDFFGAHMSNAM